MQVQMQNAASLTAEQISEFLKHQTRPKATRCDLLQTAAGLRVNRWQLDDKRGPYLKLRTHYNFIANELQYSFANAVYAWRHIPWHDYCCAYLPLQQRF